MVAGGGRRGWRGERRGTRDAGAGREAVKENNRELRRKLTAVSYSLLSACFCLFI